jgi:hypothetical protein
MYKRSQLLQPLRKLFKAFSLNANLKDMLFVFMWPAADAVA